MKPAAWLVPLGLAAALCHSAQAQSISMNRAAILLFEQPGGFVLGSEKRVYTTHFDVLRTRFITVEIAIEHAAAPARFTLTVGCQMTRPDGRVIDGIWKIGLRVAEGATRSSDANLMFGAGRDGWQAGSYKVQCSASRPIAETSFEMVLNPPDVNGAEVRVAGVQFFPTGPQVVPKADRKYLDRFSQAEATRIAVEVAFTHPALGRSLEVPLDCYFLTPSGNVLSTMNLAYKTEPQSTGGTAAMGIGWDQPGKWTRGDYLAICQINGRPVSLQRFTVW